MSAALADSPAAQIPTIAQAPLTCSLHAQPRPALERTLERLKYWAERGFSDLNTEVEVAIIAELSFHVRGVADIEALSTGENHQYVAALAQILGHSSHKDSLAHTLAALNWLNHPYGVAKPAHERVIERLECWTIPGFASKSVDVEIAIVNELCARICGVMLPNGEHDTTVETMSARLRDLANTACRHPISQNAVLNALVWLRMTGRS